MTELNYFDFRTGEWKIKYYLLSLCARRKARRLEKKSYIAGVVIGKKGHIPTPEDFS